MLRIDEHDGELRARIGAEEWALLLPFRNNPGLIDAIILYDQIMAPFYQNNFILNKVVPEAWRFRMLVFLLHLADRNDPLTPTSGLTLGAFQAVCKAQRIASSGRAFAYLNIMRVGGYLRRQPSALDRRVVHLEPTEKLMATVEEWNDNIFRLIDTIAPESRLLEARSKRDDLGRLMRRNSTFRLLGGWDPINVFPEVLHFAGSDGGWMLIAHCAAKTLRESRTEIKPIAVDLSAFGEQFGGSRSHLRRILVTAYEKGLLDAPPNNGGNIAMSPQLLTSYLAWFASYFANYQRCTQAALDSVASIESKVAEREHQASA